MSSSVDPTVEIAAVKARLDALAETCYEGIDQGLEIEIDGFGNPVAYRDFEPGSVIPAANGRLLAANEQSQPHIWAFQIHHVASTRRAANAIATATDKALIGWVPSTNSGPIVPFFFVVYDEAAKNGERVKWIATRFYETSLGVEPDMAAINQGTPTDPTPPSGDYEVYTYAGPVSSVSISHFMGRIPAVTLFIGGEVALVDYVATTTQVIMSFPTPQSNVTVLLT